MNNPFLKKVLKTLPRAVSLSVESFLIAPPAVIFFGLMYGANFDPHVAGITLAQTTKNDLGHLWSVIGWISFFTFIAFGFLKSAFFADTQVSSPHCGSASNLGELNISASAQTPS